MANKYDVKVGSTPGVYDDILDCLGCEYLRLVYNSSELIDVPILSCKKRGAYYSWDKKYARTCNLRGRKYSGNAPTEE